MTKHLQWINEAAHVTPQCSDRLLDALLTAGMHPLATPRTFLQAFEADYDFKVQDSDLRTVVHLPVQVAILLVAGHWDELAFHFKLRVPKECQFYRTYWCNVSETTHPDFKLGIPCEDDRANEIDVFNREVFVECARFLRQLAPHVRGHDDDHTGGLKNLMATYETSTHETFQIFQIIIPIL